MKMRRPRRNGLSRVDVLACSACAVVLMALCGAALSEQHISEGVKNPKTLKDTEQLGFMHRGLLIYSAENEGRLPIPGLINRQAIGDDAGPQLAGKHIPGMGAEDTSLNTTAHLYSSMIAQNFFTPELVISPVERNPRVKEMSDYAYDQYNPADDQYWDTTFAADLEKGSNASYPHQPITKDRKHLWNNQMLSDLAQLGNRGPKDGASDPDSYTCSPHGLWAGTIVFGDNHTEFLLTATPEKLEGDNLFKADERKFDSLVAFTKSVKDGKAELQFD